MGNIFVPQEKQECKGSDTTIPALLCVETLGSDGDSGIGIPSLPMKDSYYLASADHV